MAELCSLDRYKPAPLHAERRRVVFRQLCRRAVHDAHGETIKRLVYNYQLAEGAQAWEIGAWRSTDGVVFHQMTSLSGETYASGTSTVITTPSTGAIDVQLAVVAVFGTQVLRPWQSDPDRGRQGSLPARKCTPNCPTSTSPKL